MGLYNAFPDLQRSGDLLVPIDGSPPDLREPPDTGDSMLKAG